MRLDAKTWAEVRRLYGLGDVTCGALAAQFGVSPKTIQGRAKREGWETAPESPEGDKPAVKKRRRVYATLPTPGTRRKMIGRLYRAISLKLEHMEARMASGESRSAQDEERESRALGAMIRNFEKVTEVVADLDRSEGARPKDAAAVTADAERMRREIAERLGRLATERAARGCADESR